MSQAYSYQKYYALQQYSEALPLFLKAAEAANAEAAFYLGLMYENGRGGLAKDDAQALIWFRKAVDGGSAAGMSNLGFMYANGRGGLAKDEAQAVSWYRKAVDGGDAVGMRHLGAMYENGRGGLAKDDAQAVAWYRKAADAGDAPGMNNLGVMYANRRGGLAKDETQAMSWFRKAADAGDANSMRSLGFMYENGRGGLAKDDAQAVSWYRKAADAGNAAGMRLLGGIYLNGRGGLTKDEAQAVSWWRKAADGGDAPGMRLLGLMYESGGSGLEKDHAQAVVWWRKAADAGDASALEILKRLAQAPPASAVPSLASAQGSNGQDNSARSGTIAPTCMPGDQLTKQNGNYVCVDPNMPTPTLEPESGQTGKEAKTFEAETESLRFSLAAGRGVGWHVGHRAEKDSTILTEFVPKGETVDNYKQIVTQLKISSPNAVKFHDGVVEAQRFPPPEDFMKLLKEGILRQCPNVVWNVIEKIGDDILYEWRIEKCSARDPRGSPIPDQHNLGRIFKGKRNGYQLTYMRKTKELPVGERNQWLTILREAKVVEDVNAPIPGVAVSSETEGLRFSFDTGDARARGVIPQGLNVVCVGDLQHCSSNGGSPIPPETSEAVNWRLGFSEEKGDSGTLRWVPRGETVDNYTKMLTELSFPEAGLPSSEDFLKLLKESMLQKCPNIVWNVIEKIGKDILYEWSIESCSSLPDQHNIARIFKGNHNGFQLAYMRTAKEFPVEARDQWLKVLREAKVVSVNK